MKFEFSWNGDYYDCEWFDGTDFELLDNVVQVYGFLFDSEGKICIVNVRHNEGGWCLPGGGPEEEDDSFEDTLIREVDEEADLDIKGIRRIGYIRSVSRKDPEKVGYAVRYVASVDKVRRQSEDPCHGKIPLRKFVDKGEFIDETGWDNDGTRLQLKKAIEVFEKGRKRIGML